MSRPPQHPPGRIVSPVRRNVLVIGSKSSIVSAQVCDPYRKLQETTALGTGSPAGSKTDTLKCKLAPASAITVSGSTTTVRGVGSGVGAGVGVGDGVAAGNGVGVGIATVVVVVATGTGSGK